MKHDLLAVEVGAVGAGEQRIVLFPGLDPALRRRQRAETAEAGRFFRQIAAAFDALFARARSNDIGDSTAGEIDRRPPGGIGIAPTAPTSTASRSCFMR
jgi:hypothetical protein